MQKATRGPEAAPRRGVYLTGLERETLFFTLRQNGALLREAAALLKYTLREAWDLTARGPRKGQSQRRRKQQSNEPKLPGLSLEDFEAAVNGTFNRQAKKDNA